VKNNIDRRRFLKLPVTASIGMTLADAGFGQPDSAAGKTVRLGVVGTGSRGTNLLEIALSVGGVEVPALCDINRENLAKAQDVVLTSGRKKPEGYSRGEEDYKRLMDRDDIDAILIATPWEWHTPMAVCSMKARKYTGVEVPAAITIEQCWELVNTQEQTGTPCMMMENWSFRQDNLAVLNMIRAGLLGEINHCHCAHSHNCIYWYFDENGNPRWTGEHLLTRNADQYPTHSLGPVISWMDINCGDYPAYITSTATRSISIKHHFAKKFGPDHPACKRPYKQADIVTSVVKTIKGNTIVINNDMQSPRPYDNRWEISGTDGLYNEQRSAVYIEGRSPKYEAWEPFDPYLEKYDHAWYRAIDSRTAGAKALDPKIGHGGPDFLEVQQFLRAVRNKAPTPIDIYDSVIMCAPIPLSEQSIANGSAPVPFPDFTRGNWKVKKPYFGVIV
jgi:predicted dehydrogenase